MFDQQILDEIVALQALRVQKVFGLLDTMLVLELYSPAEKRLFFVFDQNLKTPTLHVQREKPPGVKLPSPLVSLLNKYAKNKTIKFLKLSNEDSILKAQFSHEGENFSLIFESFPRYAVGLFRESELLASLGKHAAPDFRKGYVLDKKVIDGLASNLAQSLRHEHAFKNFRAQASFSEVVAKLRQTLSKKQTLLKNVQNDLATCTKNLGLLADAELLRANLYAVKRGMSEIELFDYALDPPKRRIIALDPSMSGKDYLEKVFNKIKRAKRGMNSILPRMTLIEQDVAEAKRQLETVLEHGVVPFLDAPTMQTFAPRKISQRRLPYRTYRSQDGIKILVGRSARDSDELTLHYTSGNDWWFHAREVAGAHVVVKSGLEELPKDTFIEAAMLAHWYSKSKLENYGIIQYTKAKYVRKPKGVAVGMVLIAKEKTVEIAHNEERLKSLLAREEKIGL